LTLNVLDAETGVARHDLKLDLIETQEGLKGCFEYKADLFEASTISQMAELFQLVLSTVIKQPDIQLTSLRALLDKTRKQCQLAKEKEFQESRRQKLGKLERRSISGIGA
ncbi:MAG: condensation domain-containing protein, partial [Cyanobacteria bacterium P01_D01_bin.6]